MADYPPLPGLYDVPDHLIDVWITVKLHAWIVDELMDGCRELTTGCRCQETPGWYPGRPAVDGCPLHNPHRCSVRFLGRSWRSEGCGWRCPTCRAVWTLTRSQAPVPDHTTQYGTHPRNQCGPAFCHLLPIRPVMQWIRDE